MGFAYMAIDTNIAIHDREKKQWNDRGIPDVRVDSMSEGIKNAMSNQYLYIVINADNINYMPGLKILRETTNDPILIATSTFSIDEQTEAYYNGADFYGKFSEPEKNMKIALAVISNVDERAKKRKAPIKIISYGNILLIPTCHRAFVNDIDVCLNKTEMEILGYMINNRGRVLTYNQIHSHVWPDENTAVSYDSLYGITKRLRQKLRRGDDRRDYIENVRSIGYRFITEFGE